MKNKHYALFYVFLVTNTYANTPLVSIITSVYKGDEFITQFMEDITQQTIFDQCQLIMINANSPGNEQEVIREYMNHYPNIMYLKLDHDPGIYAVWNLGIKMAQAPFVTNANLDDRLKSDCYHIHLNALLDNPSIDLVYSDFYITYQSNETFEKHSHVKYVKMAPFSVAALQKTCLPNNHPMWRKSMHERYGYFNEIYKSAGDWEMWKRAASHGAQFLKVDGTYGLFYYNPEGLSTNPYNKLIQKEEYEVRHLYKSN